MTRRDHLEILHRSRPVILPSLLLCDFGNLEREVERLKEAGVQALHLDVMDGRFVPNLTYGMPIVAGLRKLTDMTLDVHLMIEEPRRYLKQFVEAGADVVTFHVEAESDPGTALRELRQWGVGCGLALNPETPLSALNGHLEFCDLVLVMSVQAGFGGQSFQPVAIEKLAALRASYPHLLLEVDGGVNRGTVADCVRSGADMLVVGSAIFGETNYRESVVGLKQLATQGVRS